MYVCTHLYVCMYVWYVCIYLTSYLSLRGETEGIEGMTTVNDRSLLYVMLSITA